MDYKQTLHLPQTEFPMKASLPVQEPERLKHWDTNHIYQKLLAKNAGKPKFVLHDGPPYANGSIHFGHILNKTLKDIIIKQKNMIGFLAPFIPGWDCHGLPIELGALKDLGEALKVNPRTIDTPTRIKACREYAQRYIDDQKKQFQRLGIFGNWDEPYLTLDHGYEADIAAEFLELYLRGSVTQSLKPVHWCTSCRTALAEAEVEYENAVSPSIYVPFKIDSKTLGIEGETAIVIWTTTPWTLPANVALAVGEAFTYDVIKLETGKQVIVASDLTQTFLSENKLSGNVVKTINGPDLVEKVQNAQHPFLKRQSRIVIGHHVSLETGTGIVHIAPGHGQDDFVIGLKEKLPVLCPVDAGGCFYADNECFTGDNQRPEFQAAVNTWVGQHIKKANPVIVQFLHANQLLLSAPDKTLAHSYPHCWRCKNPIIFRATEQWFCSLEHNQLRQRSLSAIDNDVRWIPGWGRDRIHGMIANRPDWCLSRQRTWGVPIIVHHCTDCRKPLLNREIGNFIIEQIRAKGIEAWHENADPVLPPGTKCSCGSTSFVKDGSILDVWFDSGVSHAAVLRRRAELDFPADLYLEGSDQHRGWFHSSLLTSMAINEKPPYKAVLTHGFVVDGQGKKYSKSAKNYTPPEKIIDQYGAELLRLWVAAEDYRNDIRVSDEIIKVLSEIYRKIRNTYRFILGSLSDFNPQENNIPVEKRTELDACALDQLNALVQKITKAYDEFEFHVVLHAVNRFFTVELSAFYLDILKDRLYCDATNSVRRRAAQSTLYDIIEKTLPLIAPILSFTAEEIWSFVPNKRLNAESVFLLSWPKPEANALSAQQQNHFDTISKLRTDVFKQLEAARKNKLIGQGLDAKVTLHVKSDQAPTLAAIQAFQNSTANPLTQIFICSQVVVSTAAAPAEAVSGDNCTDVSILISKADGTKCERCWTYSTEVGQNNQHPGLCKRCSEAV